MNQCTPFKKLFINQNSGILSANLKINELEILHKVHQNIVNNFIMNIGPAGADVPRVRGRPRGLGPPAGPGYPMADNIPKDLQVYYLKGYNCKSIILKVIC